MSKHPDNDINDDDLFDDDEFEEDEMNEYENNEYDSHKPPHPPLPPRPPRAPRPPRPPRPPHSPRVFIHGKHVDHSFHNNSDYDIVRDPKDGTKKFFYRLNPVKGFNCCSDTHMHSIKSITIRGVDENLYQAFNDKIKELRLPVGEAFTKLFARSLNHFDSEKKYMPKFSAEFLHSFPKMQRFEIADIEEIILEVKDLDEMNAFVTLVNINRVVLGKNMTREIINRHINKIIDCDIVEYPKSLPKLFLLSKLVDCKQKISY